MKLHSNVASPFARKVRAVAIETGLAERIEEIDRMMTPVRPDAALVRDNPLGKIPCLVIDDGTALNDSRVICEYLDGLHDGQKAVSAIRSGALGGAAPPGSGRWHHDAGVLARYETSIRPEERRWPEWVENQKEKFRRALDALEAEAERFGETVDIGMITVGCALGYLDFRYADEGWRAGRPKLAAWVEGFARRPSMAETAPREVW